MPNVVFVAPFFLETTLRFVDAAASVPGVRLGLVSQDPDTKLPPGLRSRLAAHERVENGLDLQQILAASASLGRQLGKIDRMLGTLEELQVPLAEARAALGIDGMSVEAAHNFRDKARMKKVLEAHELPCARHQLVTNDREAWEFAQRVGYPLVMKPPAGAGARNTFRIDSEAALRETLQALPLRADEPALLEEFMTGEEHSFDSVFVHGRPIWYSISRYFPTPLDVLRNPWIQWVVMLPREIDGPEYDTIRSVAARSLEALGMRTGLSHMEWFRKADGSVAVSEVAARPPGAQFTTLLSYAHDTDMYAAWARLMVLDEFDPPQRRYAAGAAFLRGQGSGRVHAIHGLEEAQRALAPVVVEARLPKAGQPASGTYEGEGYVIVRHPETAVVEKALKHLVSVIRVELQ
jgi:biotin carboxylase